MTGPARPGPGAPVPDLVTAAAHVFVTDLGDPRLGPGDFHHLSHTLRLRAGEAVTASDGAGSWRLCRWRGASSAPPPPPAGPAAAGRPPGGAGTAAEDGGAGGGEAALAVAGPVTRAAQPLPALTVGFAPVKAERPEWVVRRLTETGVDRLVLLTAARSVVRWDEARAARQLARLEQVARQASMQCRRVWLPEIWGSMMPVAELAASLVLSGTGSLAHPGGDPPTLARPVVLVGPEGGWDDQELACGLPLVGLGESVLRSETAALAAGVVLGALRAGLVEPALGDETGPDRPGPSRPGPSRPQRPGVGRER